MDTSTIFLTTITAGREPAVHLMIDGLRSFGWELADAPVWVFARGLDPMFALEELVCFTYEDRSIHPNAISGIEVRQPLNSWLISRITNE